MTMWTSGYAQFDAVHCVSLDEKKNGTSSYSRMFFYGAPGQRTVISIGYNSWGFPNLSIGKSGIGYIFHLRKMK